MLKQSFVILIVLLSTIQLSSKLLKEQVAFAINCGGNAFTDSHGIIYKKVFLTKFIFKKNTYRIKTLKEAKFLISDQARNLN